MTLIPEKEHAILGPSGWDRWSTCPGSIVLEEGRPNRTSIYAAWGTVAHEIAATCLRENADAEGFVDQVFKVRLDPANPAAGWHAIQVDMEMADAINTYIGVVHSLVDPEVGDVLLIEQEVPIGHLTGETDATGTADAIAIVGHGTKMIVIDFKGGQGVTVEAAGNGQLRMYALGALEKLGLIYEDIDCVELMICQPRVSDEPSSELLLIQELRDFADEVTIAAGRVELARGFQLDLPPQYLEPSEKACKFCRAKAICPALRTEVETGLSVVSTAEPLEFADLTMPKKAASIAVDGETDAERLASFMRAAPLIEEAIKAVRAEIERRLLAGAEVPGFYLGVGKAGNRKWKDEAVAEVELKKRLKADEMYEKKVISIAKAEKLFKSKPRIWAKIIEEAGIDQAEGKPSVCQVGVDKNKPYELGARVEDFDDLTVGGSDASALLAD